MVAWRTLGVDELEARVPRVVGVGLEQQAAARAHRAVDEQLDRPHPEAVAVEVRGPADEGHLAAVGGRRHAVDAELQLALPVEPPIDVGLGGRDARVVDGGQAGLQGEALRRQDVPGDRVGVGRRDDAADQAHGAVDEDAGGSAVGVAEDLAVGGGLGLGRDAGAAHRLGVGPAGVAVDAAEPDRAVGRDGVEDGGRRERAAGPEALVPVAARDPAVAGRGVGAGLDPAGDLLQARDAPEVHLLQRSRPASLRWPWASIRPGIAKAPGRSTSRVVGPRNFRTSSAGPTATISPPRAARASAQGRSGSPVQIRPTFRIRSGGPSFGSRSARPASFSWCLPSAMAATPLTNRYWTPGAYRVGSSKVAASRKVAGSKATTSAKAPGRSTPRSGSRRISAGRPDAGADGLLQGDDPLVQGVAHLAGEGAVGAGVGTVGAAGGVGRAVGGGRDEVPRHDVPHVVLGHAEVDRPGTAVPLDVQHHLQGRRPLLPGDGHQVAADPLRLRRVAGDPDPRASPAPVEHLLDRPAQARPLDRVVRQAGEFGRVPLAGPVRDDHRRQGRARGDVRVLVGADGLPRPAGRGDPLAGRDHRPPVRLAHRLQVRDVHRQPGLPADRQGLVDGAEQPLRLVADVAGIDPAVPRDDPRQRGQLGGVGVAAGQVDQAGRHAPGPRPHATLHQALHPLPARRRRPCGRRCRGPTCAGSRAGSGG